MSENCCSSGTVMVYPCSGAADVGLISDKSARVLREKGFAKMSCLAGVGAGLSGYIETAKGADVVIALDGCPTCCARRVLENAGASPRSYIITEMGYEKGKTPETDEVVSAVCARIMDPGYSPVSSGGCGCSGKC